jgi:hypothetical protein
MTSFVVVIVVDGVVVGVVVAIVEDVAVEEVARVVEVAPSLFAAGTNGGADALG